MRPNYPAWLFASATSIIFTAAAMYLLLGILGAVRLYGVQRSVAVIMLIVLWGLSMWLARRAYRLLMSRHSRGRNDV